MTLCLCKYVQSGVISLVHTPTLEMLANGFTKSLPPMSHYLHSDDMGLWFGSQQLALLLKHEF